MALQSSGEIKLSQINTELGRSSTSSPTSLEDASRGVYKTINTANAATDRPDGTAPHALSEWYSYNHTASSGPAEGAYPTTGVALWTGNQGTSLQTDTVDLSSNQFVGESVIDQNAQFFFRFDSGSSFRSDAQILSVSYNNFASFGNWSTSIPSGTKTTSLTTNTDYNHSSGWLNVTSGTTVGRWNQLNGTPASSSTGVNANALYYESSGSGNNKKVWLRLPSVVLTSNSVTIRSYGYGSNMGTLRFGVYIYAV